MARAKMIRLGSAPATSSRVSVTTVDMTREVASVQPLRVAAEPQEIVKTISALRKGGSPISALM